MGGSAKGGQPIWYPVIYIAGSAQGGQPGRLPGDGGFDPRPRYLDKIMARRSKLTKKTTEAICDAITIGATYEIAAVWGGVTPRTFYYWMERGRKESDRLEQLEIDKPDEAHKSAPDEAKFFQFFHKVFQSNVEAGVGWLNVISNSAAVDPVWARYLLEQRFPKDYGQKHQKAQISYNVDVAKLTDEQLLRISQGEDPEAVFSAPTEQTTQDLTQAEDE